MDAVPIVPPLFRAPKNTTLHELQTGDRSRATDKKRRWPCVARSKVDRLDLSPLAAIMDAPHIFESVRHVCSAFVTQYRGNVFTKAVLNRYARHLGERVPRF